MKNNKGRENNGRLDSNTSNTSDLSAQDSKNVVPKVPSKVGAK